MSRVPKLRFKEFSGEWEKKKLGNICTFFSGGTPTSSNKSYYDGNIPFIGSGKINADSVDQYITEEALKNSSAKLVKKGDLLYALYGATSGEVAISKLDGAINQAVLCIRSQEEIYFLLQWLLLNKTNILSTYLQGGQGNLSAQIIKSLDLYLPSKPEQQKNASFLSTIDTKIDQLTRKKELLEQYKKGVMQKIFSQELRFKADDGSEFPEWEEKSLDEMIYEKVQYPSQEFPLYSLTIEEGVVPKSERYERSFLVKEDYEYKIVEADDFVYNPMNLRFGALARHRNNEVVVVSKYYNIFACRKHFNALYAELFLKSYPMIQYYNKMATGSLVEKKRVHFSEFLKFKFFFPCHVEQTKIAHFFSAIGTKIDLVTKQLDEAKNFKKGLLQQMFV